MMITSSIISPRLSSQNMKNMEEEEEYQNGGEDFLNLSLSLSLCDQSRKKRIHDTSDLLMKKPCKKRSNPEDDEKKALRMLQARDDMIRSVESATEGSPDHDDKRLEVINLLLAAAVAVDGNNKTSSLDCLTDLYRHVSLHGDPIQRVAAYFADGLAAKLLSPISPFHTEIVADPDPEKEFAAFTELYRATPFYQFAHFTANQVIIETFEEERKNKTDRNTRILHVVDLDIAYGFQWPSLIQSLSDKANESQPISLRITGLGKNRAELKETEMRLTSFAKSCSNLLFEFYGVLKGSKLSNLITAKKNETLVVNSVFCLQNMRASEISSTFIDIQLLSPSVVVLVDKEDSRKPGSFLSMFMDSLHYYAAMFDSLDDCFPTDNAKRLSIEKNHLGREIKRAITSYDNNIEELKLETWRELMKNNGHSGVKMSAATVSQAKLLLRIKSSSSSGIDNSNGFKIIARDGGMEIALNWRDRHLLTASAWC